MWTFSSTFLLISLGLVAFLFRYSRVAKGIYNFTTASENQASSNDGKVNILLMGKSGGDRDGADLTDTIILVSLSLTGNGINMISIPRDVWVPDIMAKINSTYYWGKNGSDYFSLKDTGGGIPFAKKMVGKITGQPIQYGVVVDFSAFKDIVDAIGGVNVDVKRPFVDKFYPVEGKENDTCGGDKTYACRYETVIFDSGVQYMDGETALKYVRSRHAEGEEGTDLAREARQQKVIEAIKEKILQPKKYLSVKNIKTLLSIGNKYIETDIDIPVAGFLARKILDNIKSVSQSSIPEDLLIVPLTSDIYDNLYVFIPKMGNGNWGEIQSWFSQTLK